MSERIILHSDLNNFFASVESVFRPELKTVPMAVCGSTAERHGIVLAKNEKAKKFGVKTAEAIWQAKQKCPFLTIVEPHYDEYLKFSSSVRKIYETYTDMVEPFGIDECWLDVSASTLLFKSGKNIANELREKIKKETGLTVSVGVSFNKVFAKLGSDLKKPDAVTVIEKSDFKRIVWPLEASQMLGVGRSTQKKLDSIGIKTIGQIAKTNEQTLKLIFGKSGTELWKNANGFDDSPVLRACDMPPAKSFGRSITCLRDLVSDDDVKSVMLYLCEKVCSSLRENQCFASVVQIHVRDENLIVKEKQLRLLQPSRIVQTVFEAAMSLFRSCWSWETNVRSVGVRACCLVSDSSPLQYSIFCDNRKAEKLEKIENSTQKIKEKYGSRTIFHAGSMLAPISRDEHPSFHFKHGSQTDEYITLDKNETK